MLNGKGKHLFYYSNVDRLTNRKEHGEMQIQKIQSKYCVQFNKYVLRFFSELGSLPCSRDRVMNIAVGGL